MNRHDEQVWRAQISRSHRPRAPKRKLSRHYPRLRARLGWNAVPALRWGLAVAVILLLIRLAI